GENLGAFRLFYSRVQQFFVYLPQGGEFRSWCCALRLYNSDAKSCGVFLERAETLLRKRGAVEEDYASGPVALVDKLFPKIDSGSNFKKMHVN
ncbi:unnamed protein product, partial [Amoebophrya sp. A120]